MSTSQHAIDTNLQQEQHNIDLSRREMSYNMYSNLRPAGPILKITEQSKEIDSTFEKISKSVSLNNSGYIEGKTIAFDQTFTANDIKLPENYQNPPLHHINNENH